MEARIHVDRDLEAAELMPLCGGDVAFFTARKPGRDGPNEDAALVVADGAGLLAVADGAGGEAAGAQASAAAVKALAESVTAARAVDRESILAGFDRANEAVQALQCGAATTLAVVAVDGDLVRSYHVGDSLALVVGQRGKRKLETIAHSPVGYAIEAGVLDENEALLHEERHVVSNMVGSSDMRVEMSAPVRLARRDTVLLASDGLTDNLHLEELVEIIRKGPPAKACASLARLARDRMTAPRETLPSKPDDLTFLLYRPGKP